jgi:hypothetical protein
VTEPHDNVRVLPVRTGAAMPAGGAAVDALAGATRRARFAARWNVEIDPPLAFVVFLSGVLLIGAARALEPAPVHEHAAVPLWLLAVDTFVWAGVAIGGVGLVKFRRYGLGGAALAAGALLVESATCVLTGHHRFGLWWVGQIVCTAMFAAAVAVGFRINAAQSKSAR